MQGEVGSVLAFAVLAVVAPLLTTRMRRLRLPVAVVEILLGMVFGKTGLNLLTVTPIIQFLSLFGLSYLMFLSGLEIDAGQLTRRGQGDQPGLGWPIIVAVSVLAVGAGAGLFLGAHHLVSNPLAIGLLIGSSAPTVVLPTLREVGRNKSRNGQITLRATLVVDILALLGVSLVAGATSGGAHVLLVLVLLVPLLAALLSSKTIRRWWLGHGLESVTAQIAVRGALAVILLFIAVSQTLGVATVLGAFMAGVIISLVSGEHRGLLQEKMETVGYGYFIPFFFLLLGAQITVAGQFSHILELGGILLVAFLAMALIASGLLSWAFRSIREGIG
ncbi:MAG: cation:proton antiporter, partial [Sulfobacillus sp.]